MEGSIGKNQTFIPLQTHTFQPLKYCLVIICCLYFPFLLFILCPPLHLYCSKWIFFLEEAEGTFWYLLCSTSDLGPTLLQTNYYMTFFATG